jgi:hypothetical protein
MGSAACMVGRWAAMYASAATLTSVLSEVSSQQACLQLSSLLVHTGTCSDYSEDTHPPQHHYTLAP